MIGTRGRDIAALGLALVIWLGQLPAFGQDVQFRLPANATVEAAIDRLAPDQRNAIKVAAAEVFPLFIFIPGIMGSRLTKTLPDGRSKVIWGKLNGVFSPPDRDLEYNSTDDVKAEVMDEYFALGTSFDVYGKAVQTIKYMDISAGDNVRLFAYDWRQSNRESAKKLAGWLCKQQDEFKQRPLVFLAHSMGGLVLKTWLKDLYDQEGCGAGQKFSDWVQVKKVIFLGTPHYGTPKAVAAFADSYSIMVDRDDTLMSSVLGSVDAATLSRSVNAYGATFPSAYELLPIVNTNDCFKDTDWAYPVSVKPLTGNAHSNIDLFNKSTWQLFNWPKNLGPGIDRAAFLDNRLPTLLASAKEFLCSMAKYRPDESFDVVRVSGDQHTTICAVTIIQPPASGGVAAVRPEFCPDGDGTVPRWVASEDKYAMIDKMQFSVEGHMHLVGSREFLRYLAGYQNELHRNLQKQVVANGNSDALVAMYASLRTLVPSAVSASNDPNDVAGQIARRVAAELKLNPNEIYAAAKSETDRDLRATGYRVAADVSDPASSTRAWALNNAAHIYLQRQNFPAARDLGKAAVSAADESRTLNLIKGSAGAITATAAEQLNDKATARVYRDLSLGRTQAVGGRQVN